VFSDDALLGRSPRLSSSSSSSAAGSRNSTGAGAGGEAPAAAAARGRRWSAVDVCWVLTCAYLGFMVCYGLWKQSK
jgi:hypothetical protein